MKKTLKSCRVLVTPTSFGKSDPGLKTQLEEIVGEVIYNQTGKPLSAAQLLDLLPGMDGYIAGLDEINAEVIQACDQLQVISRYGVGVDRVDLDAAKRKGIVVTNTPGANAVAVAELAITFILSLARDLHTANHLTHSGEWPRLNGMGLRGRVIGLIGFGAIGRAVAERLQVFGCRILVSDPFITWETACAYGVEIVGLEELAALSDFISLHAPAMPETIGMINDEFFSGMKSGAFLINTARGELIDDAALERALEQGKLAGAALDVFSKEPPDMTSRLFEFPQVIVTPHISSHTDDAVNQMGKMALKNCLDVLQDKEAQFIVV
jgi:D-3-phosphoglycerate dehydrogenase